MLSACTLVLHYAVQPYTFLLIQELEDLVAIGCCIYAGAALLCWLYICSSCLARNLVLISLNVVILVVMAVVVYRNPTSRLYIKYRAWLVSCRNILCCTFLGRDTFVVDPPFDDQGWLSDGAASTSSLAPCSLTNDGTEPHCGASSGLLTAAECTTNRYPETPVSSRDGPPWAGGM